MDLLDVRAAHILRLRLRSICLVLGLWHSMFGGFSGLQLEWVVRVFVSHMYGSLVGGTATE